MTTIDEAIAYIDDCIETIIKDMITFRAKMLDASSKVLDKVKALMDATTYIYRLGDLYDKAIKVETDVLKQADIVKPRLKLQYVGAKTSLMYNSNYIEVPSVPVFVWEPKPPEGVSHEMGVEVIRRNISLKFPIETNIAETPDVENAYGKYYSLEYRGMSYEYVEILMYDGRKLNIFGAAMEIESIPIYMTYYFRRTLTIDGTQYLFYINFRFGKVIMHRYIDPTTTIENVEYPCTLVTFGSEYGGDVSAILFGNEVPRGPKLDAVYARDVLFVYATDKPLMFILT